MNQDFTPMERQAIARSAVGYGPIQLATDGNDIVVRIEVNGAWFEVIRTFCPYDGVIDHTVYPLGMAEDVHRYLTGEWVPSV